MHKILTKDELYRIVASLSKECQIIGPKDLGHKGIFYETMKNVEELYLGDAFCVEPVKKFFLCPSETLFDVPYKEGKDTVLGSPSSATKRIILGLRPCEARGLELLDKVFNAQQYKDGSYVKDRERTVLIGLSCAKPDKSCFCTSMGGSPAESRGMDAMLFSDEDKFIVEVVTDKAKEIFAGVAKEPDGSQLKALDAQKAKRKDLVKAKIRVPQTLDKVFEDAAYWQRVSAPCLSCGVCTFLCPTCHCFDLLDEQRQRLRCYDGCAFPDFTLEASGVNPRPTKKERYRQRVFHKFDYFKKNFGENLCVGCGRCIRFCPVKIDIAQIVDKAPV